MEEEKFSRLTRKPIEESKKEDIESTDISKEDYLKKVKLKKQPLLI